MRKRIAPRATGTNIEYSKPPLKCKRGRTGRVVSVRLAIAHLTKSVCACVRVPYMVVAAKALVIEYYCYGNRLVV